MPGKLDIKRHSPSILYLHKQVVISYKFNECSIGEFYSFQVKWLRAHGYVYRMASLN